MRRNQHYHDRVNRVLDYISEHLDGELSLTRLSAIGCFSPFHFHRIFQGVTGETLNSHVRRVRLERAALLMKTSPRKRITDVALATGFAGTAEFSRAFKNHFDRTASSWDRRSPLEKSKICKAPEMLSFHTEEELHRWKAAAKNVRVRVHRFSAFRYVYIRIYAPYGNTRLVDSYHALTAWLAERRTDIRDVVVIGMSLDDPPSRLPRIAAMISASPSRSSRAACWARLSARGDGRRPLSYRCRPSPSAMRRALASAISSPSRSSPSTASETSLMWIAPGTICTGSGFLRAPSSPRICRQWRCSYGFRRK
jgi:AraC-like DNA-binding protein